MHTLYWFVVLLVGSDLTGHHTSSHTPLSRDRVQQHAAHVISLETKRKTWPVSSFIIRSIVAIRKKQPDNTVGLDGITCTHLRVPRVDLGKTVLNNVVIKSLREPSLSSRPVRRPVGARVGGDSEGSLSPRGGPLQRRSHEIGLAVGQSEANRNQSPGRGD